MRVVSAWVPIVQWTRTFPPDDLVTDANLLQIWAQRAQSVSNFFVRFLADIGTGGARGGFTTFQTWTTQIYIFAEIEKKFLTKPFMASCEEDGHGIGKHYLEMSFWNFITPPAEERGCGTKRGLLMVLAIFNYINFPAMRTAARGNFIIGSFCNDACRLLLPMRSTSVVWTWCWFLQRYYHFEQGNLKTFPPLF